MSTIGRTCGAGLLVLGVLLAARPAHAMHIMEGFLPPSWALLWFAVAAPFWLVGLLRIQRIVRDRPEARMLLGVSAAFTFVLSALKLPSLTGSSSHPTGTGLGTVLFGPTVMSVLATTVLLFQALLLAHGGLTTLGANAVSMAVAGPFAAWALFAVLRPRAPVWLSVLLAATVADLVTYVVTAAQLALAYPDPTAGFIGSFAKFGAIFAVTQIPLALSEGLLTMLIYNGLRRSAALELGAPMDRDRRTP